MANTRQSKVTRIDARFGDIDSCTLHVRKEESAIKGDKLWVDLNVSAYYAEDTSHFYGSATEPLTMYTLPFHLSLHPTMRRRFEQATGHTTTPQNQQNNGVKQGEAIKEDTVTVMPFLKEYKVDNMSLDLERLPCGVSATISGHDGVAMDRAGNSQMS